jgi:hypothetical protein
MYAVLYGAERLESVQSFRSCAKGPDADGDGHLPRVPRADRCVSSRADETPTPLPSGSELQPFGCLCADCHLKHLLWF